VLPGILVALVAVPAAASAAPVKYAGKTSSGHRVTFKLRNGKQVLNFATGAPVTCIPIQGGGQTFVGAEPIVLWFRVNRKVEFPVKAKPGLLLQRGHGELPRDVEEATQRHHQGQPPVAVPVPDPEVSDRDLLDL
jgi:hypothetical protein